MNSHQNPRLLELLSRIDTQGSQLCIDADQTTVVFVDGDSILIDALFSSPIQKKYSLCREGDTFSFQEVAGQTEAIIHLALRSLRTICLSRARIVVFFSLEKGQIWSNLGREGILLRSMFRNEVLALAYLSKNSELTLSEENEQNMSFEKRAKLNTGLSWEGLLRIFVIDEPLSVCRLSSEEIGGSQGTSTLEMELRSFSSQFLIVSDGSCLDWAIEDSKNHFDSSFVDELIKMQQIMMVDFLFDCLIFEPIIVLSSSIYINGGIVNGVMVKKIFRFSWEASGQQVSADMIQEIRSELGYPTEDIEFEWIEDTKDLKIVQISDLPSTCQKDVEVCQKYVEDCAETIKESMTSKQDEDSSSDTWENFSVGSDFNENETINPDTIVTKKCVVDETIKQLNKTDCAEQYSSLEDLIWWQNLRNERIDHVREDYLVPIVGDIDTNNHRMLDIPIIGSKAHYSSFWKMRRAQRNEQKNAQVNFAYVHSFYNKDTQPDIEIIESRQHRASRQGDSQEKKQNQKFLVVPSKYTEINRSWATYFQGLNRRVSLRFVDRYNVRSFLSEASRRLRAEEINREIKRIWSKMFKKSGDLNAKDFVGAYSNSITDSELPMANYGIGCLFLLVELLAFQMENNPTDLLKVKLIHALDRICSYLWTAYQKILNEAQQLSSLTAKKPSKKPSKKGQKQKGQIYRTLNHTFDGTFIYQGIFQVFFLMSRDNIQGFSFMTDDRSAIDFLINRFTFLLDRFDGIIPGASALCRRIVGSNEDGTEMEALNLQTLMWQLGECGDILPHSVGKSDPRTPFFHPDPWQLELLNAADEGKSMVVATPTSSGKTFISYYICKRVMEQSDEGVVIFLVPTRTLAMQVYSEVSARFQKNHRSGPLVGMFMSDLQTTGVLASQIVVTTAGSLEILLLDGEYEYQRWRSRLQYLIVDEAHNIFTAEGNQWELPFHAVNCPIVMLSATMSCIGAVSEWLQCLERNKSRIHNKECREVIVIPRHEENRIVRVYRSVDLHFNLVKSLENERCDIVPMSNLIGLYNAAKICASTTNVQHAKYTSEQLSLIDLPPREVFQLYRRLTEIIAEVADEELEQLLQDMNGSLLSCIPRDGHILVGHEQILSLGDKCQQIVFKMLGHSDPNVRGVGYRVIENTMGEALGFLSETETTDILPATNDSCDFGENAGIRLYYLIKELQRRDHLPTIAFLLYIGKIDSIVKFITNYLKSNEDEKYNEAREARIQEIRSKIQDYNNMITREIKRTTKTKEEAMELEALIEQYKGSISSLEAEEKNLYKIKPEFSFALCDLDQLLSDINIQFLWDRMLPTPYRKGVDEWLIEGLKRGIGFHHSSAPRSYRVVVEALLRKKYLGIVFSTDTLSSGLNAPCRSVLILGDSIHLSPTKISQMIGRAGRRGFDMDGQIYFYGLSSTRLQQLLTNVSIIPSLHFATSSNLVVRINQLHNTLVHNSKIRDKQEAGRLLATLASSSMMGSPLMPCTSRNISTIMNCFVLEYLTQIDAFSNPSELQLDASGWMMHLVHYATPGIFSFLYLFRKGVLFEEMGLTDSEKVENIFQNLVTAAQDIQKANSALTTAKGSVNKNKAKKNLEAARNNMEGKLREVVDAFNRKNILMNILCHLFQVIPISYPHKLAILHKEMESSGTFQSKHKNVLDPVSQNVKRNLTEHDGIVLRSFIGFLRHILERVSHSADSILVSPWLASLGLLDEMYDGANTPVTIKEIREIVHPDVIDMCDDDILPITVWDFEDWHNAYIFDFLSHENIGKVVSENKLSDSVVWHNIDRFCSILRMIARTIRAICRKAMINPMFFPVDDDDMPDGDASDLQPQDVGETKEKQDEIQGKYDETEEKHGPSHVEAEFSGNVLVITSSSFSLSIL